MKEPVLVVMAAGMGSRYGGLKQIDKMTDTGEIIVDFSLYDAMMAGFDKAVFVIKRENEKDFRELLDNRAGKHMDIGYAYQELTDLPKGHDVPSKRVKPWGTAHAVMSCRHMIDGPFAVINADDYYGPMAFHGVYEFLAGPRGPYEFCMEGYALENAVTENGHVSRGICTIDEKGYLSDIVERTMIQEVDGAICFSEDEGETWTKLERGTTVSMNFWGYSAGMMDELVKGFPEFLDDCDPLKGEYLIPKVTDDLIKSGKASVKVLKTDDRWYGVTYRDDREQVKNALESMKDKGLYPDKLWK